MIIARTEALLVGRCALALLVVSCCHTPSQRTYSDWPPARGPLFAEAQNMLGNTATYRALPGVACENPDFDGFWRDFELHEVRQASCGAVWEARAAHRGPCANTDETARCAQDRESFVADCGRALTQSTRQAVSCSRSVAPKPSSGSEGPALSSSPVLPDPN